MCDYSLAHFPNRLAVKGERLMIHRFSSGTLGLTSQCLNLKDIFSAGRTTAICVPPGARLLLRDIPEQLQKSLGLAEVEEVTFVELSAAAFSHRDAVRFANGREILLQDLHCAQRVDVLSVSPASDEWAVLRAADQEKQDWLAFVG
jgi:hypothetical protein